MKNTGRTFDILVQGDSQCGKSSFLNYIGGELFSNPRPTQGFDIEILIQHQAENQNIFQFYELGEGNKLSASHKRIFKENYDAYILVFDLNNLNSLINLHKYIDMHKDACDISDIKVQFNMYEMPKSRLRIVKHKRFRHLSQHKIKKKKKRKPQTELEIIVEQNEIENPQSVPILIIGSKNDLLQNEDCESINKTIHQIKRKLDSYKIFYMEMSAKDEQFNDRVFDNFLSELNRITKIQREDDQIRENLNNTNPIQDISGTEKPNIFRRFLNILQTLI